MTEAQLRRIAALGIDGDDWRATAQEQAINAITAALVGLARGEQW